MTSISSLSGSTSSSYRNSLDTNGDGIVSADELAAAGLSSNPNSSSKPSLLASLGDDTDTGNDPASKLQSVIMQMLLQMSGGALSNSSSDGDKADSTTSTAAISDLDTDGDGVVSAAEFAAAKPDDVTDDMSTELFAKLDEDGSGGIDAAELQKMEGGPPQALASGSDQNADSDSLLAQIQAFAKQFMDDFSDNETSMPLATV